MRKKLHNPKSHAPAIYIPCWLSQVSVKLLSHGAKLIYGRLSQWCDETGQAYRSAPQLAEELGMCESSVKKYQKELRDVQLIGTFHPQAGGVNHFEFYDHPWMHEPINENLVYKNDKYDPVYDHTLPSVRSETTPVYDHTPINKKEIKENKKTTTTSKKGGGSNFSKSKKQMLECKLEDDSRTDDEFLEHCDHHIKNNGVKDASVYKRTIMLIGLLKVLMGEGEHFKSKGYVNPKAEKERAEQEQAKLKAQLEHSEQKRLEMIEAAKSKPSQENRSNGPKRVHISIAERMKAAQHANA